MSPAFPIFGIGIYVMAVTGLKKLQKKRQQGKQPPPPPPLAQGLHLPLLGLTIFMREGGDWGCACYFQGTATFGAVVTFGKLV